MPDEKMTKEERVKERKKKMIKHRQKIAKRAADRIDGAAKKQAHLRSKKERIDARIEQEEKAITEFTAKKEAVEKEISELNK